MSTWSTVQERIAGRWQIPLFGVSVVALFIGVLSLRAPDGPAPIEQVTRYLEAYLAGGMHDRTVSTARRHLAEEGRTPEELGPIHMWLARGLYARASEGGSPTIDDGEEIVSHYREAEAKGIQLTSRDYEWIARAFEFQRMFGDAVSAYEFALGLGPKNPHGIKQRIIELRQSKLADPPDLLIPALDEFVAGLGGSRLDLRLWAVEQKLDLLDSAGRVEEAATLLSRQKEHFDKTDLRDRFAFLEAKFMYRTGLYDEAERHLRAVRDRVATTDEVHAMTGWLLGRVVLSDGGPQRPQEAISFFQDVIDHHYGSPYATASWVGLAEANAYLEDHDEAIKGYRHALEELKLIGDTKLISKEVIRTSAAVMAEIQRQQDHLGAAIAYANLANDLVDRHNIELTARLVRQLADLEKMMAEQLTEKASKLGYEKIDTARAMKKEAREHFVRASELFLDLAQVNTLNEKQASKSSWEAAELRERGGMRLEAAGLYWSFARERPEDPLVPRALYRLGTLYKALGDLDRAIDVFQECASRYPHMLEGVRSLIPLAQCYMALGKDHLDLAEKTLLRVLEDPEVLTTETPEFADALFLLGDVLNRGGTYEDAIGTLEEWIERYRERTDDPARLLRVRFLLADSYRQSGLALKRELEEASFTGQHKQMQSQSIFRLRRAAALCRELIQEYAGRSTSSLSPIERLYLRHARLYEADCLFEMQDYKKALKLYEEAAGLYQDSPSALAAYVQVINCHVFLGDKNETQAALARAMILVDQIPESSFSDSVSPETRDDWRRYFEWLGESELF